MTPNDTHFSCFRLLQEIELYHKLLYVLLTITVVIPVVGLNSYVIHLIRTHMTLQTYVNGLVVNLCIADIVSIASLILLTVTRIVKHHVFELIADRLFVIAYNVTVLMITAIAVDRFASLKYSLNYSSRMTGTKVTVINAGCWIYSLLVSMLPFVFERMPTMFGNTCSTVSPRIGHFILKACLLYFPCLIVIFLCYCKIYGIARCHSRAITAVDRSVFYNYPSHRIQQSMKYVPTLLQVLVTFLVLTLPEKLCLIFNTDESIHFYFVIFASINCVFNPLIYAYNRSEFRTALRPPTPIRNAEALRRGEAIADALSIIFGNECYNSRPSLENKKSMTEQDKTDSEGDSRLSWSGFVNRKCSYTSRVSVKLHKKAEVQLKIEDLECNLSGSNLQLSFEPFGPKSRKVTITSCSHPSEMFKEDENSSEHSPDTNEDQIRKCDIEVTTISDNVQQEQLSF